MFHISKFLKIPHSDKRLYSIISVIIDNIYTIFRIIKQYPLLRIIPALIIGEALLHNCKHIIKFIYIYLSQFQHKNLHSNLIIIFSLSAYISY